MKIDEMAGRERFCLEQLHAGECEETAQCDKVDRQRRAEIERELDEDDARLFERLPAARFAANVAARLENERTGDKAGTGKAEAGRCIENGSIPFPGGGKRSADRGRVMARVLPLAAAAAIAVAVGITGLHVNGGGIPFVPTAEDVRTAERVKGITPIINIYRAEGQGVHLLDERARARRNDLLQLEYNGAGYPYGVIVSVDGRGTVTLHYPAGLDSVPALEKGKVLLPYAYQLDDAPEFERFFFVTSERQFEVQRVLRAARILAAGRDGGRRGQLRLSGDFVETSMTIMKEKR